MKYPVILLLIVMLASVSDARAFEPLFDARIDYDVGSSLKSVFACDLDGDGDNDLAVANGESNRVSVLRNNGDGSFLAAVNYVVGSNPGSVIACDLDGDGDKDLATANTNTDNVSILKNNGNGTFQAAVNYGVGDWPNSIFASDLDGDGDSDLAVANYSSDNVSVLKNNGNGTYLAAVNYGVGDSPRSVFASDLDGDGDNDLAVANTNSDNVSILRNNGNGTYQPALNYAAGDAPFSVYASDLDDDGDNDLAMANYISDDVSILKNNGDGTFEAAVNYGAGIDPNTVFACDLDGDGDHDLAAANGPGNVSILRGNGNGTFQAAVNYGVGSGPASVFACDLDGDGDRDLATANYGSYDVSILLNNGDGTFQVAVNYGVGSGPASVFACDLDGDGDNDLAVANTNSDNVSILRNNGNGTFQAAVNYSVGSYPWSVFARDLDGDGDNDLAVANEYSDNVSVLKNNGNATFQAAVNYGVGSGPASVFACDLDGDGDYDLAVANFNSDNVSILANNGDGTFQAAGNYGVGDQPFSVFASDLDGDGDNDLATANYNSSNVSILKNNGDGTFPPAVNYGVGYYSYSVFACDLDRDGDNDLAVANNYSVSIMRNNGDGSFQTAVNYRAGYWSWWVFAIDLDGDGYNDLAVANQGSNNVSIWRNNGDGTFQAAGNYGVGDQPFSVFASDLDGDGDNDLAAANWDSDNISILKNLSNIAPPLPFCQNFSGLFCDDFEDGLITNWQSLRNEGCTWSETGGVISTSNSGPQKWCIQSVGNQIWDNYTLEGKVRGNVGVDKVFTFRIKDANNFYAVNLRSDYPTPGIDKVTFDKMENGVYQADIATADYTSENGVWYQVKVECINRTYTIYVNNNQVLQYTDNQNVYFTGGIGIACWTGEAGTCNIGFDDIKVTEFSTHQAILQGHVNTAQALPQTIEGAAVEIRQSGHLLATTTTNSEGYYSITLPVGLYDVSVSKQNYEMANLSGVSVPQQGATQDFELLQSDYANLDLSVIIAPEMFTENSASNETNIFTIKASIHNGENRPFSIVTVAFIVDGEFEQLKTFSIDPGISVNQTHSINIPTPWPNKTVRVRLEYVNGWKATYSHPREVSSTVSVVYLSNGSAFRLNPDAYQFSNPYGWPLIKKYFQTTSPTIGRLLSLLPAIVQSVNGVCFGMAGSSSAYFLNPLEKPLNVPTHSMTLDMQGVSDRLVQYHLSQLLQPEDFLDPQIPSEMGNSIRNALLQQHNVVIALFDNDLCSGHAISAYKTIIDHGQNDEYVTIYDNESPWITTPQIMKVGLNGNGYMAYPPEDPRWQQARAFENVTRFTDKQILKLAWNAIKKIPRNLACGITGISKKLQIMCPVHPLIIANNGQGLGFINDSTWVSEIDSAYYAIWQADSTDSCYYFELPMNLQYDVTFAGVGQGNAEILYFAPATDSSGVFSCFDSIQISQNTNGYFHVGAGVAGIDTLYLDINGDQIPDTSMLPIVNTAPGSFELINPDPGQCVYHPVNFSWQPAINLDWMDTINYAVFVSSDSTFTAYDSSQYTIDTSFIWLPYMSDSTTYYWKVKAIDKGGLAADSWEVGSFLYRFHLNVIRGFVFDQDSNPIEDVSIEATGTVAKSCSTGLDGAYILDSLKAGTYSISFSHRIYRDTVIMGLSLISADTIILNMILSPSCRYLPGDINGNGQANGIDVTYGVSYLKGGNPPPNECNPPCMNQPDPFYAAMDVNGNCTANGIDITYFVSYLKGQQPALLYCQDCPPADHGPAVSRQIEGKEAPDKVISQPIKEEMPIAPIHHPELKQRGKTEASD